MTELEQLRKDYEAMGETIARLEKEEVDINYWQPEPYSDFFAVNIHGEAYLGESDDGTGKIYRSFKTKEEAKKYAEYVRVEETLREAIAKANQGWLPDWNDNTQRKYFIMCVLIGVKTITDWTFAIKTQPNFMYIKSQEIAEKLMKDYKAEFRTYFSY